MQTHRYKKLLVWQKSMELLRLVYILTKKLPKEEQFGLSSQIKRAALSIPSNIAEGSHRNPNKDFAHFLHMAMGSVAEVETQVEAGVVLGFWTKKEVQSVELLTEEVIRMLVGLAEKQQNS